MKSVSDQQDQQIVSGSNLQQWNCLHLNLLIIIRFVYFSIWWCKLLHYSYYLL